MPVSMTAMVGGREVMAKGHDEPMRGGSKYPEDPGEIARIRR
jgi:hypothetical protein